MREIKSYAKSVNKSNSIADNLNKIIVFGYSIIHDARVRGFREFVNNGYARFKVFPGASSKKLLHYIDPILENGLYNTAVVHIGVNDLLHENSLARVELSNIKSGSHL